MARGGVPWRRRGARGWESGRRGKAITRSEWEAAGRWDKLMDEAHEDWAWSSTQAFRDGESDFMRQP
jgi:hypothetical protein